MSTNPNVSVTIFEEEGQTTLQHGSRSKVTCIGTVEHPEGKFYIWEKSARFKGRAQVTRDQGFQSFPIRMCDEVLKHWDAAVAAKAAAEAEKQAVQS